MRSATLFAALAVAAVLMVAHFPPGGQQVRSVRSPPPTAAEEAGPVIDSAPPRAEVSGQVPMPKPPRVTTPIPQSSARQQKVEPGRSTPSASREGGVRIPSGKRQMSESERPGQSSSDEGQSVEKPDALALASARPPVLTPPILLTPVAGYPAEGYRIVVDPSILTPRLRVEAAQGRVVLRILVRGDGSVEQVNVVESSGSSVLDEAAVKAATGWSFEPATRDGQPVDSWAVIPVRFIVP